jgi:hypothetical protein
MRTRGVVLSFEIVGWDVGFVPESVYTTEDDLAAGSICFSIYDVMNPIPNVQYSSHLLR